jgi:general secretion pathway protein E
MEVTALQVELGRMLVEGSFIDQEQLDTALELSQRNNKKLEDVLLDENIVTSETLTTCLSMLYRVPVVDLNQVKMQAEVVRLIPEQLARERNVLAISSDGDSLRVAMEDPHDVGLLDTLAALTGMRVKPVLPLGGGLNEIISSSYNLTTNIAREVAQMVAPTAAEDVPLLEVEAVARAPVVRAVDMIVAQAVKERASDVHIIPRGDSVKVLYRIDGVLHEAVTLPLGVHAALVSRIKVLSNMNIAERRRPQDGQFSLKINDKDKEEVDFRVATAETHHGEMVAIRVLDKSGAVLQLTDIGLQPNPLQLFQTLLTSPFGMLLVSGPTGSGKTTSLYSALNQLIPLKRNILTIEDPIEYHFEEINQLQVNRQAGVTFAAGLRAIMRLDPDIILVGEIRDAETATTAVQAALTGHLVLSSIHANDAAGSIIRLIDMGVEPFLVVSAVIGAVAQRLVRRVCPYCLTTAAVPPAEAMAYQNEMHEPHTEFQVGRGCNFCSHTGFRGRVGVFEVLAMNDQIRALVPKGATASEIRKEAISDGMIPMRHDGMLKAKDAITTPGEVVRNVFNIMG